jgi:hypothetical protein
MWHTGDTRRAGRCSGSTLQPVRMLLQRPEGSDRMSLPSIAAVQDPQACGRLSGAPRACSHKLLASTSHEPRLHRYSSNHAKKVDDGQKRYK